jgi:hypothetical protein
MADWSVIEAALGGWVNTITGLPVIWRKRPQSPTFDTAGYALLEISAIRSKGQLDDLEYEYDAAMRRRWTTTQSTTPRC